jgi:formylglycine-generating enzyme required for sulfatase activity
MVLVKGGSFAMGDIFNEGDDKEKPVHQVKLNDFYMGRHELTVAEFAAFVAAANYRTTAETDGVSNVFTAGGFTEAPNVNWKCDAQGVVLQPENYNHPVLHVSWFDAVQYCNWLSLQHGYKPVYKLDTVEVEATPEMQRQVSGSVRLDDANKEVNKSMRAFSQVMVADWSANGYRLPSEAEWEYAARSGGKEYRYAWGNGPSPIGNVADDEAVRQGAAKTAGWLNLNDGYAFTSPAGKFPQGDLGLADMTGNVWEWCSDWYAPYPTQPVDNYSGPTTGTYRVLRGGGWRGSPPNLRITARNANLPESKGPMLGFRLARNAN